MHWIRYSVASLSLLAGMALVAAQEVAPDSGQETPPAEAPAPAEPKRESEIDRMWRDLVRELQTKVVLSGFRVFGYHNHRITGDRDAFKSTNYGGLGNSGFTNRGTVRASAQSLFGFVNFDATVQDNRLARPQDDRLSLNYRNGDWQVDLGDVRGTLANTNRFARMDKTLRGVNAAYRSSGFSAQVVRSEVRGESRTVSVPGNNTAGPYYLQSSQIVRGSERIRIDDEDLVLGQDYIIDYEVGSVTFVNRQSLAARVVPASSSIVATYEAYGITGSRGTVEGGSMTYNFGAAGQVGVTMLRTRTGATGSLSTRVERFQGFGAPSTPYFLQFEPLAGTNLTIRADGVLQVEGVDYRRDNDNPAVFYFNRTMPSDTTIEVLYTPRPTTTVQGDRETFGIDYRIPLGTGGNITLQQATGRALGAGGRSGLARGIDMRWGDARWGVTASLRDIPSSYVAVETVGFERNERAADARLTYRPNVGQEAGLNFLNTRISTLTIDNSGNSVVRASRLTLAEAYFNVQSGARPWGIRHRRTATGLTANNSSQRTTLESQIASGAYPINLELSHEALTGGTGTQRSSATVSGINLRARTNMAGPWSATGSFGFNRVTRAGVTGNGKDMQLSVGYVFRDIDEEGNYKYPSGTLRLDFTDSDSGALATLGGLNSGFGSGYGGNGFSGGSGNNFIGGANRFQSLSFSGTMDLRPGLTGFGGLFQRESRGDIGSNTRTLGASAGLTWSINDDTLLSGTLSQTNTEFIGETLSSQATTFDVTLDGRFNPKWTYQTTFSGLLSGGGSQFAQDIWNGEVRSTYRLAPRQNLTFYGLLGNASGYLPQDTNDFSLTYQYQIWDSLALNVRYRWQDIVSRDATVQSGAFKSRGFDIELGFNFGF